MKLEGNFWSLMEACVNTLGQGIPLKGSFNVKIIDVRSVVNCG